MSTQFTAGTGGGVYAHVPGATIPTAVYLEAPVELPIGANITNVSFFDYDCGFPDPLATYYFGAYKPLTSWKYNFTRAGRPITTVKADYSYILGVHSLYTSQGAAPQSNPAWVIAGARVRFTCPSGCSPI